MILATIRNLIPPLIIRYLRQNIFFRLRQRKEIIDQEIVTLYAEVTTHCNARCFMCSWEEKFIKEGIPQSHMSQEIVDKFLESVQKLVKRGKVIRFFPIGLGEPLLFPGLLGLFRDLKAISQNVYIVLTTNGVPLTKSTFIKLIDSGVDEITISLNADSPEGYRKVMGIDKYETALKNSLNVLRYKKELGLKSPQISIQFLDSVYFKNSFYRTIKFWLPYLTGNDKVYFHEIVSEAGTCDIGVQDTGMQNLKTRFPCSEPWQRISVLNDGAVYPCGPVFYWKEKKDDLYLGNIFEKDLIDLCFDNPKLKKIKDAMLCNDYSKLPTCAGCNNPILSSNPFKKDSVTQKWILN
jgi:MoaA/NifB/PqqE/SkfB family radical SAM enzyme